MNKYKEKDFYESVVNWLCSYLKRKYNKASYVICDDTSKTLLSDFIERNNLSGFFPALETYKIQVDVTGIFVESKIAEIVIVEVKLKPISLTNFAQILGYSKVVKPKEAFIVSPTGWSSVIEKLIRVYKRSDILLYDDEDKEKKIRIAKWDTTSNSIRDGDYLS